MKKLKLDEVYSPVEAALIGLGGATQVAQALGLKQQAVESWKRNGVPKKHLHFVSTATGIPARRLLVGVPDLKASKAIRSIVIRDFYKKYLATTTVTA